MNKAAFVALSASILSGCTTHPSLTDSSVNRAGPSQFVSTSQPDVLTSAYEQRVRQRADELYRTRQAGSLTEAEKKARAEFKDNAPPQSQPDSVYAQREASVKAAPVLDQKALDAAAEEVSRQRTR